MVYQHLVWPRDCARCVGYEAGRTKRLWPHGSLSGREDRLIRGPSCNVERAMREVTCGVEPGRRGHGSLFSVKGTGVGRGVHQMSSKAPSSSTAVHRCGQWKTGPSPQNVVKPKRNPSAADANITGCPHHVSLDNICLGGALENRQPIKAQES